MTDGSSVQGTEWLTNFDRGPVAEHQLGSLFVIWVAILVNRETGMGSGSGMGFGFRPSSME